MSPKTGLAVQRIDGAGAGKYPLTSSLLNRLPDAESSYALEVLLISNANPYYTMADARSFQKQIEKIPFVVSFSSYMDETAMHADLILPNHVYLERYTDVPVTSGMAQPLIGLARPIVEPLFDTMNVGDVIIRIAQELGGSIADAFPWESYDACLEETLGDKWETLNEEGFWVDEAFQAAELGERI